VTWKALTRFPSDVSNTETDSPEVGRPDAQQCMHVLLFAGLAERLGCARLTLNPPWPVTVAELQERLVSEWPELAPVTFRTAVNQRYALDSEPVQPEDEIALIPPVSGG
jgi:molybdopterin converting factor subunit 1